MKQDEMIEMAKQAGWQYAHGDSGFEPLWAFAKLVAAKEREACAMTCIHLAHKWTRMGAWGQNTEYHECAEAIRARGEA